MPDSPQDLRRAHAGLAAALRPLAIEIGRDVLDVWLDRHHHGVEPLPASALEALARWAGGRLEER
jgi:hypothetical protein